METNGGKGRKTSRNTFFMADNARIQKQLKKQIEELEKQYEYMKNVSKLI